VNPQVVPQESIGKLKHAAPTQVAKYAHVGDMAKKNPALFIPAKVG
jgi:hypothetical protein